jgi:glycosyltransferase involved in cell wall biosynthesis
VCAVGVCFTQGRECTRCHGRNTLPGVRHACRGSLPEAAVYAAGISLGQRRLLDGADAVVVPSRFAHQRLLELGAPLPEGRVHVLAPPLRALLVQDEPPPLGGEHALVVSRLSAEKGVDVAIDACRMAGISLVVAGEGPQYAELRERAAEGDVRFVGRVGDEELERLRAGAAIALIPSRAPETFGLAAAEAMAAGLPVAASEVGAFPELLGPEALVAPGDPRALAEAIGRLAGDREAGERGRARVGELCSPDAVAGGLRAIYAEASGS